MTEPALVATAYFARSAELTADAAALLERPEDERRYRTLADEVRRAFAAAYLLPDGSMSSDSQTAYSLLLEFCLVREPERRAEAGRRLAEQARRNGYRIGAGFLGTPIVCDALCSVGDYTTAYRLLLERECPSWLYPVTVGATTIWERWDSLRPDGSINASEMTSFNHYSFGAIADWLHRTVAGLAPGAPGYRRLTIRPLPGGGLTYARARHRTPYGVAEAGWRIVNDTLEVDIVVPPGTKADVTLPGHDEVKVVVGAGSYRWVVPLDASGGVLPAARRPDRTRF
jgi:alpha-L-rhamnosidase